MHCGSHNTLALRACAHRHARRRSLRAIWILGTRAVARDKTQKAQHSRCPDATRATYHTKQRAH
eukprot:1179443-Pyramimonas_sp.AAC.1